jgi:hypothetical protein
MLCSLYVPLSDKTLSSATLAKEDFAECISFTLGKGVYFSKWFIWRLLK